MINEIALPETMNKTTFARNSKQDEQREEYVRLIKVDRKHGLNRIAESHRVVDKSTFWRNTIASDSLPALLIKQAG